MHQRLCKETQKKEVRRFGFVQLTLDSLEGYPGRGTAKNVICLQVSVIVNLDYGWGIPHCRGGLSLILIIP